MAMLKFKKGLYQNLPAVSENTVGTIYVTTDEQAMYVDVASNKRIRISDFIRVNTVEDITPPYSTSSLYYVEADNALLKYTGKEKGWKQVNGTDDLKTALNLLTNRVSTLETTVGSATSGLVKKVNDNAAAIEANATAIEANATAIGVEASEGVEATGLRKDIADLKAAIGMGEDGEIEGLDGRVTQAERDIDDLQSTVNNHTGTLNTLTGSGTGSVAAAKAAADAAMAKANEKTTMTEVEAKNYATKTEAQGYANAKDAAIEAAASAANAAQSKADAAHTLAGQKATLADVAGVGYALATDVETDIDDAIKAEVERADGKYATQTALTTLSNTVTSHTSKIGEIETALESVVTNDDLAAKGYATTANVATAKQEAIDAAATAAAGLYATKTDLNTTNGNVNAAQSKANDAYTLAETKTTTAAVKTQIEAYGYATTSYVDQAETDAIAAAKTAGDKAYAAKSIESTVSAHTSDLTTLKGAATVVGSVAEAKKAGTDAQASINEWKTAHTNDYTNAQIDNAIKVAKDAADAAQGDANTNASAISQLKADLKAVTDDYITESELATVKSDLQKEIDDDIRAANAMEYAGTINKASDLPGAAKNGATYVVGTTFGTYAAGDMLIAQGTEDPDTGLITAPTWEHVKSGYDASLDQTLTGANNKIMLSNGVNNDEDAKGAITFTATGSASVSVADNTVTIGMVWEDFE